MRLFTTLLATIITISLPLLTLADDIITNPPTYGTAASGALSPAHITPAPNANQNVHENVAAGLLTIAVTNRAGSGMSIAYGHNAGGPGAIGNPGPGAMDDGAATTILYPTDWAGRISVGKDADPNVMSRGSLIEASFTDGIVNVDVSYVNGFTVPISCSCAGYVLTGCNVDLWSRGVPCPNTGPGPICYNPSSDNAAPTGLAPAPFFAPCQGAAYVYPEDNGADRGCSQRHVSCCVGEGCPANKRQPVGGSRKRGLGLHGGHAGMHHAKGE